MLVADAPMAALGVASPRRWGMEGRFEDGLALRRLQFGRGRRAGPAGAGFRAAVTQALGQGAAGGGRKRPRAAATIDRTAMPPISAEMAASTRYV